MVQCMKNTEYRWHQVPKLHGLSTDSEKALTNFNILSLEKRWEKLKIQRTLPNKTKTVCNKLIVNIALSKKQKRKSLKAFSGMRQRCKSLFAHAQPRISAPSRTVKQEKQWNRMWVFKEEDKLSYISMACSYTGKTLKNASITVSKVIAHKITKYRGKT